MNHFEVLLVDDIATIAEIRAQYLKFAQLWHPDRVDQSNEEAKKAATVKFQHLQRAYEVLTTPNTRLHWMLANQTLLAKYFGKYVLQYDITGEEDTGNKRKRGEEEQGATEEDDMSPPFDPAGLRAGEVFKAAKMTGIPVGEVESDPNPKRMVLAGFNTQCAVMRRACEHSIKARKIAGITVARGYRELRGATLRRENIRYLADWANVDDDKEGHRIFEELKAKKLTEGWGYRDYAHMQERKWIKGAMTAALERERTEQTNQYRYYEQSTLSTETIKTQIIEGHKGLQAEMGKLEGYAKTISTGTDEKTVRRQADKYQTRLEKLQDRVILLMGRMMEAIGEAGTQVVASDSD